VTTEHVTPAELAAIDQHWQTINRTLDNLLAAYRNVTSDGQVPHVVDLLLFAGALPETVELHSMGALLACAIARLAEEA
jgi:hypothetical protein